MMAKIAALESEKAELAKQNAVLVAKTTKGKTFNLTLGKKGSCCIVGQRKFPISFYLEEWKTISEHSGEIDKFFVDNAAKIAELQKQS